MKARDVGVIGGGLGGLALAALLAQRGHDVTVYERGTLGGKLSRLTLAGREVSTGPSLFTFPGVWARLLARLNEPDPLDLQPLPDLGVHLVRGRPLRLPVPPDDPLHETWARYEAEVRPLAPAVLDLLTTPPDLTDRRFLRASARLARVTAPHLTAGGWLRARRLPRTLHDALSVHALNGGVGPRAGSVLYALLPGLIARDVHRPAGGMHELALVLARLCAARGVTLREHTDVHALQPDTAGVRYDGGAARHDLLVSAVDPTRLATLLGHERHRDPRLSVSGVAVYAVYPQPLPLPATTVVVPGDLCAFERAAHANVLPPEPMALVHHDHGVLSVLLTAPARAAHLGPDHPWVRAQLERLQRQIGLPPLAEALDAATLDPAAYALGGALGGAIYGRLFPAWRSGPLHPERYRPHPRLWQVGGGVHPGGGLPAVLGGALIVDELIQRTLRR